MLVERRDAVTNLDGLIFPSSVGTAREASNAGLTARQIADVLGHARPSMTQDVYMGRRNPSRAGAEVLDSAMRPEE
jgi:integrase